MRDEQAVSKCMGCGKVFRTTSQFDAHRVNRETRRCLTTEEMLMEGWQEIGKYWRSPTAMKTREHFKDVPGRVATRPKQARNDLTATGRP